ncbi:AbrB/MazE/SpoVT family DNA-binding domain-containing protein [Candidatus Gottesmanbacteria bacterium]|nr:AbrB/MazE/SpoVT family DNA-binding domain-containing protein [Candidatus Gottesmanbacteria bacterium]
MTPPIALPVSDEWVKILGKGMVTIPKKFRDDLGMREGEVARIRKIGNRLVVEPRDVADYETYTDDELRAMLRADKILPKLAKKARLLWSDLP